MTEPGPGTLVDSNVLLDLFTRDPRWSDWSGREYRRRGGARTSTLPDFSIGAHAAVTGMRLLTRDASRFRTYLPTVAIIAPDR